MRSPRSRRQPRRDASFADAEARPTISPPRTAQPHPAGLDADIAANARPVARAGDHRSPPAISRSHTLNLCLRRHPTPARKEQSLSRNCPSAAGYRRSSRSVQALQLVRPRGSSSCAPSNGLRIPQFWCLHMTAAAPAADLQAGFPLKVAMPIRPDRPWRWPPVHCAALSPSPHHHMRFLALATPTGPALTLYMYAIRPICGCLIRNLLAPAVQCGRGTQQARLVVGDLRRNFPGGHTGTPSSKVQVRRRACPSTRVRRSIAGRCNKFRLSSHILALTFLIRPMPNW